MRHVYSLLWYPCLPLVLLYFVWRGLREPDYWRGWGQRLGFGRPSARGGVWVHAASVGEVAAAIPLVRAVRERHPRLPCLVTVMTPTGLKTARAALAEQATVRFLPLDFPGAVRRFLRRAAPRLGLIVETEIWPNLLYACARRGVPMMLVNGRLSDKSVARYRRWPWRGLMAAALSRFAVIAAAGDTDSRRFAALAVPGERIINTGNPKFDVAADDALLGQGEALRRRWGAAGRPVWVAASTHAGEEEIILDAFDRLRRRHTDALLVLVPRHPQRFETIARRLIDRGLTVHRRSRNDPVHADTQVILGDTVGELPLLYATADLAFVGGSLVADIGGHNILEPAARRLPVIVGPHVAAWAQAADWLQEAGALRRVTDAQALADAVAQRIEDRAGRMRAGLAAAHVVASHGGALERILRLVPGLLLPASATPN